MAYLDHFTKTSSTITDISLWNLSQLQSDLVFGMGAFFLYIIVPTALLANEVRLAQRSHETSGVSTIVDAITQAGFSILIWLVFITLFSYLLVGVAGHMTDNHPAVGIYHFWSVDWMGEEVMKSLENGFIHTMYEEEGLIQAQTIVFVMALAKMLELVLLAVLLFSTIKMAMLLPLYKMQESSYDMENEITFSSLWGFAMIFSLSIILFTMIIHLDNLLITSVLEFALNLNASLALSIPQTDIDILSGLWNLLKHGVLALGIFLDV